YVTTLSITLLLLCQLCNYTLMDTTANSNNTNIALNRHYARLEALKLACREAAILGNFEFATVKSDKKRYTIKCKYDQCPCHLYKFWSECTRFLILSTNFRTRWYSFEEQISGDSLDSNSNRCAELSISCCCNIKVQ